MTDPTLPKAVIFDLDDTLFAERVFVSSGMAAVAAHLAEGTSSDRAEILSALLELHAESPLRVFDRWVDQTGHAIHAAALVALFRHHEPVIEPWPGMIELLGSLLANGRRLGIVTDGYEHVQRRKLRALACADLFGAVVFTDSERVGSWKPSPRGLEMAAELLDVQPSEAVYVGDNAGKDLQAARAAGMPFVWARYAGGYHGAVEPDSAEDILAAVDSVEDLARVLEVTGAANGCR